MQVCDYHQFQSYYHLQKRRSLGRIERLKYRYSRSALIRALREYPEFSHLRGQFFVCLGTLLDRIANSDNFTPCDYKGWVCEHTTEWKPSERCWVRYLRSFEIWRLDTVVGFIGEEFGFRCRVCGEKKYEYAWMIGNSSYALCNLCWRRYNRWVSNKATRSRAKTNSDQAIYQHEEVLLFEQWLTKLLNIKAKEARAKMLSNRGP
jgi:hypothetical protein